jgi:hypothetical protein
MVVLPDDVLAGSNSSYKPTVLLLPCFHITCRDLAVHIDHNTLLASWLC